MSDDATSTEHTIQQEDAKMKWEKPQFTVISSGSTFGAYSGEVGT